MRKILLSGVALLAVSMAAPASAADLAAKPYVKAPPPVVAPIYDWTGFYIGANGGWGQSHGCVDFVTPAGTVAGGCADRSGGLAGGQIGYRWQTNQFVLGLEAQGDWANIKNTRVSLIDPLISTTGKIDGIGLLTAQLGWAWNASLREGRRRRDAQSLRYLQQHHRCRLGLGRPHALGRRPGRRLGIRLHAQLVARYRIRPPLDGA